MEFSLLHVSMLIELTDEKIRQLKEIIDDPSSSDDEANDSAELSMQYIALSSALAEQYKSKWSSNSEHPCYEHLIRKASNAKEP